MGEQKTFHVDPNGNYSVEVNFSDAEKLIDAVRSAEISKNSSLTFSNVGNIEGLNLNANYVTGRNNPFKAQKPDKDGDAKNDGQSNISVDANYCYNLSKNCGLTFSGECSDKSVTFNLMVTEKRTGISFGIEYKLTGNVKKLTMEKHEFNFVIKASIGGNEITLRFDLAKVLGADPVAGGNNSDKARKPNKDGDPENDGNGSSDSDGYGSSDSDGNGSSDSDGNGSSDSDKSGAAKAECDSILIDVDFVNGKICQKVVKYESIHENAVQHQTLPPAENIDNQELVPEIPVVDNSSNFVPTVVRREANNTALKVIGVAAVVGAGVVLSAGVGAAIGALLAHSLVDAAAGVLFAHLLAVVPVLAPAAVAPVLAPAAVVAVLAPAAVAPVLAPVAVAPIIAAGVIAAAAQVPRAMFG